MKRLMCGLLGFSTSVGLFMGCLSKPDEQNASNNGCIQRELFPQENLGGAGGGNAQGGTGGMSAGAGGGAGAGGTGGGGGAGTICGNGISETGEECDDGDTQSLDGCSDTCTLEPCYTCPESGQPCNPIAAGTVCNGDQYCNSNGLCDSHCVDGVQELDKGETGIDCGGFCGACVGKACSGDANCAKGNCYDGVCCKDMCNGECKTCARPDTLGECVDIFAGIDDFNSSPPCVGDPGQPKTCNGMGACVDKNNNGTPCTNDMDCAGPCSDFGGGIKFCGLNTGANCLVNEQCAVLKCTNGQCGLDKGQVCTTNQQCLSNQCDDPDMDMTFNCQ